MSEIIEIPGVAQPVLLAGASLVRAKAAMVLMHGRGATADDILTIVPALGDPEVACLAPETPNDIWYPRPFTAPLPDNEPYLSASLEVITRILTHLGQAGFASEHVILLGFSQGASLVMEYAARNPRRYGAVVGLSGGLIGPDNLARKEHGSLAGSPVFIGCSDVDPFIPKYRVEQAADFLRRI